MQGFGKRWGALIADQETKSLFGTLLLPTLLTRTLDISAWVPVATFHIDLHMH